MPFCLSVTYLCVNYSGNELSNCHILRHHHSWHGQFYNVNSAFL
uniref:Uncharacterized protein n=1 Tax=Ciona intestinalis TaxID=7719 RepID=H2XRB2_CIOIN